MRTARLKAPSGFRTAHYHCVSRVVERRVAFGQEEKEQFVELMRRYERFCGVRVVTFCVMSNHFHVLVEVPARPAETLSDEEVCARLDALGPEAGAASLRQLLERVRAQGGYADAEGVLRRMWDVSFFMKGLKQKFTQWFNGRHRRRGTLWEARFKSVLVEGAMDALAAMAVSIDLNPVRAGLAEDPKDYRWCGYAEAVAGKSAAVNGLGIVVRQRVEAVKAVTPKAVLAAYRCWLFGDGEKERRDKDGRVIKKAMARDKVNEVLAAGGKLGAYELMRCRVRHFTDGAALGGKEFVNQVFEQCREQFGSKRKTGARPIRADEAGKLHAMRDLRTKTRE